MRLLGDAPFAARHLLCDHIWTVHVQLRAACIYGGRPRRVSPRDLAAGSETYTDHCNRVHGANAYACVLGDQCSLGAACRSVRQHVVPMGLHNIATAQMDELPLQLDSTLAHMVAIPGPAQAQAVRSFRRRAAELLEQEERQNMPHDDQVDDAVPANGCLPDDIWTLIMARLDMPTLLTLTMVSHHFRDLANDLVDPRDLFEFNLRRAVDTEHTTMTAKRARGEYLLNDKDLRKLAYRPVVNPHYQNAAPMRLYNIDDLVECALDKYETWEAFKAAREKRDDRKSALASSTTTKRDKRREALSSALAAHGLELRADSQQCEKFIKTGHGINGESMLEVVEIMREMDFLYRETDYADIVDALKDEERHYRGWYDLEEILEEAKSTALERWRAEHPGGD